MFGHIFDEEVLDYKSEEDFLGRSNRMLEENETQVEDHIYVINPHQPYTFKDGHYTVIGTPMN